MKTVLGDIRRADEDFEMIAPGDRVAVGVSGGKRQPASALCPAFAVPQI